MDFLISTYWGGIIWIIVGGLKLFDTLKFTKRNIESSLQPFTNGVLASIGAIVLGVIIIIQKIFDLI